MQRLSSDHGERHKAYYSVGISRGAMNCACSMHDYKVFFFLNGKSPEGPGSFALKINGGSTQYYKGPHKEENNA
jgi:hypothetical protein